MERPRHIDLGYNNSRAPSAAGSSRSIPSPRIQHYDGDVPPALSPLDAFAAHSRRLAKELEETRLAGQRRMSRLPPHIVTKSLSQHQASRPAIFRSLSSNSQEGIPPVPHLDRDSAGNSPEVTAPTTRPTSTYPRISAVLGDGLDESRSATPIDYALPTQLHQTSHPNDYFGPVRADSPEPLSAEVERERGSQTQRSSKDIQFESLRGLAPPNAAFARNRPYHESSDDDYTSSNAGSFFSQTRKLSSSSNISLPITSPVVHQRTPSNNSTSSLPGHTGHKKTPSHLNFSRPRSSASSYAKIDSPTRSQSRLARQASQASEATRGLTSFDDTRSVMSDGFISGEASSYTHSRFRLPRGRHVDRTSGIFSALSTPPLEWQEPLFPSTPPLSANRDLPPLKSSPSFGRLSRDNDTARSERGGFSFEFEAERPMLTDQTRRPSSSSNTQSGSVRSNLSAGARPSTSHGPISHGAFKVPDLPPIPGSTAGSTFDTLSQSSRSNSTVRPTTSRSVSNYQNMTPDDHVTKAIDLHQNGDLKESTYHLRIAAKQDHPTGMLLYALACRHGWGIRSNPKEGVAWLKKAVDSAMLEVADDESANGEKSKADFLQRKEHKAQFALSIYELGVSHLNGWGVDQDKALALRCFEIAGNWGDPDALTEAGFCYSEGIGSKKDLKKAARFYRMAEKKGVSMVGNSW